MTLTAALTAISTLAGNVSGVARAYADPPESISEFPAAVVYAERGTLSAQSHGVKLHLHTIRLDMYAERTQLPEAVNTARAWPEAVYAALVADETLSGSVAAIVWPVTYQSVAMQYNSLTHYGLRFEIPVKIT